MYPYHVVNPAEPQLQATPLDSARDRPLDAARATSVDAAPDKPAASAPHAEWQRLDPRSVRLSRTVGWIVTACLLSIYSAVLAVLWIATLWTGRGIARFDVLALTALWPPLAAGLAWLAHRFPELHYKHTTWRIDDVGLTIRTGVVWRAEISVARSRVQHIDVSQGPLERRYGLATLSVYTAGTEHSQVSLQGLEHGAALAARDALLPASDVDAV